MKYAQIWLHFKQGDDMSGHLEHSGNNILTALKSHSEHLKSAGEQLEKIMEIVSKNPENCEISADTYMIMIHGPDDIIDELVSENLVTLEEEEEEEEEEEFESNEEGFDWQQEGF